MRLDEAQQDRLSSLIGSHVPPATLQQIVAQHGIVQDFDNRAQAGPPDPDERRKTLAAIVVAAYSEQHAVQRLASALDRAMPFDEVFAAAIQEFAAPEAEAAATGDATKQAALVMRSTTLQSRKLREFLARVEGQICVIVAKRLAAGRTAYNLGTGFLVGPDVVLTAYHTLSHHIVADAQLDDGAANLWAFFDFCEGLPITDPEQPDIDARRVAFHREWLLKASQDLPHDGMLDDAAQRQQADQVRQCLDFALIRLAEPVGLQTRVGNGGARRGWIDVRAWNGTLAHEDRIIISQHPNGNPQRIDFGRYSESHSRSDVSATRVRYSTETDQGTSGAPCFNQHFHAVGMHNAAFKPNGQVEANQAIAIRAILAEVEALLSAQTPGQPLRLWSVSPNVSAPIAILRRDPLLDWIDRAGSEPLKADRSDRVYAAAGTSRRCGKSFSLDILRAARRGSTEPIVVLGAAKEPIPETVPDVIAVIADQLAIPKATWARMPPRPTSGLPAGTRDGDKLAKWASEEVPQWFAGVLAQHRTATVDRQLEARQQRDALRAAGLPVPVEILELATAPARVHDERARWSIAWMVVDRLDEQTLSSEVINLIAGLTGGSLADTSLLEELRRLRWLFLGRVPEFLASDQAIVEHLNPFDVTAQDLLECVRRHARCLELSLPDVISQTMLALIQAWETDPVVKPLIDDAARRLPSYQAYFNRLVQVMAGQRRALS